MKKNISINISGIIFHIEEDGYEQLKTYLESINRYFSNYDDSLEIIADIESRIAEIFLVKLKDGQQVVTLEDVEGLISTMGSIKDFQAAEEDATIFEEPQPEAEGHKAESVFSQKLYRDKKRKLFAGVLSGIAYYFDIDPLWVRLIYIALFTGISVLPSWGGFLFITYIVLWVIIPESEELPEKKKIKKMFRDPDNKVLGGVASGIAAYFGIDMVIVRLLFFVSIFFAGSGIVLYLILWLILPEAKTLTDKMEMQGEPVTLSNIEQNIKKSLKMETGEENLFMKILLFPFRILAIVFEFLSRALGPFMVFLLEALRILGGILLIIIGVSGILVMMTALALLIGLVAEGDFYMLFNIPFDVIKHDIHLLPVIALTLFVVIPMLMVALLGFSAIMRKSVIKASFSIPMLVLWILSVIALTLASPKYIREFKREGSISLTNAYNLKDKTIVFHLNDIGTDQLDAVSLKLAPTEGEEIQVKQTFKAMGPDRRQAIENARKMTYHISLEDTVFMFDSKMEFMKDASYRRQELDITVYIPRGQQFLLDPDMKYLLGNYLYRQGYSNRQIAGNTWMFDENGLICLTCEEQPEREASDSGNLSTLELDGPGKKIDMGDFTELASNSPISFVIKKSDHFEVVLGGESSETDQITLDRTDNILTIDYKKSILPLRSKSPVVTAYILMPELETVHFGGASRSLINGFDTGDIEIRLDGAAVSEVDVDANQLYLEMKGASKMKLSGTAENLEAFLSGAASLKAFSMEAANVNLTVQNAASARVNAKDKLKVRAQGGANVQYRGNAKVEIRKSKGSVVNKN